MNDDLNKLENAAAALDAKLEQDNTTPAIESAPQVGNSNDQYENLIRQVLGMLVVGASTKWAIVRDFYTPDQCREIAASIVALCNEYQIDLSTWLGEGGGKLQAWMRLAMAAGMPALGIIATLNVPPEATPEGGVLPNSNGQDSSGA